MKIPFSIALLVLQLAAVFSLPSSKQHGTHRPMTGEVNRNTTHKDANLEAARLQTKQADLSIHSYVKDLYANLTSDTGLSSSHEEIEFDAIYAYENQAKCMQVTLKPEVVRN